MDGPCIRWYYMSKKSWPIVYAKLLFIMGNYFLDIQYILYTVCPRSNDPFYVETYYIKWVTTSWTYSTKLDVPSEHMDPSVSWDIRTISCSFSVCVAVWGLARALKRARFAGSPLFNHIG